MTKQLLRFTSDQRAILGAVLVISAEIASYAPQRWWGPHEREEWDADCAYGPLWSPSMWFRHVDSNAEVVRLTRVLKRLEGDGLVVTFRRPGRKCTHVRLTTEGERIARQLLAAKNGKTLKGSPQ